MARRRIVWLAAASLVAVIAGCGGTGDGGRTAPTETDPGRTVPTEADPGRTAPTETDPGRTVPTVTAPGRTAPDGDGPGLTRTATTPRPPRPGRVTPAASTDPPRSWTATCPTATKSPLGCRGVRGRVLAIQSHDPDGDGDLHVVALGGDVTAPGITVFDVRPSLRPKRDPRPGELVTGAGPVFRGSFRQRQIQVDAFRVWRPDG